MSATRVLHLHFGKEGGAERFFVNLAQAFAERGVEQRFVIRPGRSFRGQLAALGPLVEDNARRLSLSGLILPWRIRRLARSWQPDAIMAWMPRAARMIPPYDDAVSVTRLGDYPRHLDHFGQSDFLVPNAPGIAEHCRKLGWTGGIQVISNFPREVDPVPVPRAAHDTPDDAFLVVASGRFVHRKGFDTVIRAVAALPDAWLWLVGDGKEAPALRELARAEGIESRCRFIGWVDEAIHYVAAGDVYCMASRHEPLGNVLLESWRAGVPVVSTRSEGPSWYAEDGEDALLVEIDAVEQMTRALHRLQEDTALRKRLAAAGARKLADRFSKSRVVDQYLELFAQGRPGAPLGADARASAIP